MLSIYRLNRSRLFACVLRAAKQPRTKSGELFFAHCMFSIAAYMLASCLLLVAGFHLVDRRQLEPD